MSKTRKLKIYSKYQSRRWGDGVSIPEIRLEGKWLDELGFKKGRTVITDTIIQNWMRNRNTIELLGFWEAIYNPNFKPLEFEGFRKQAGLNNFVMTPKKWIEKTNAIGIIQNPGGMEALSLIKILPWNLHPGFP